MTATLSHQHVTLLDASGISSDAAIGWGVRSLAPDEALPEGCPSWWSGKLPALLFPWTGLDGRMEWQLRPDDPGDGAKYLFRSREDGYQPTPWVLVRPTGGDPVVFVEGTKQALCAAEHRPSGYGVVGLAGCWGGTDRGRASSVLRLARGRKTIVVLDADVSANRQVWEAGKRLRADLLDEGATEVVLVRVRGQGGTGIDDVLGARADRAEHLRRLIDRAEDFKYPKSEAPKRVAGEEFAAPDGVMPAPGLPAPCARAIMTAWRLDGSSIIKWWRDSWAVYSPERGAWVIPESKTTITRRLHRHLENAAYVDEDGLVKPWNPTHMAVNGIERSLESFNELPWEQSAPCWVDVSKDEATRVPPAGEFLAMPSTILHMPTRRAWEPTPKLFTTHAMGCDYDPDAGLEGTRWHKFLGEIFDNDVESLYRLQEIMGYLISGRTDLEKIFLITGAPRAGKGTIGEVLRLLLGSSAVGTSVESLATGTFALASLLGKKLAIVGDARSSTDKRRMVTFIERLLSISGGDSVPVDIKFKSTITGPLRVNFLILSNEDMIIEESSGAAASRFETLEFTRSFLGKEDIGLKKDLAGELPAILNWSLDGLDRLNAQGGVFTRSKRVDDARAEMARRGAPHIAFAEECLEFESEAWTTSLELYQAWARWAGGRDVPPGNIVHFIRNLTAAYRGQVRPRQIKNSGRGLQGVRVLPTPRG